MNINNIELNSTIGGYNVVVNDNIPVGKLEYGTPNGVHLYPDRTLDFVQEACPALETAVNDKLDELRAEAGIEVGIRYGEELDGLLYTHKRMEVFRDGEEIGHLVQAVKGGTWRGGMCLNEAIPGLPNDTDLPSIQAAIQEWYEEGL